MSSPVKRDKTLTQQLLDLPENQRGEIINGELVVSPRPSGGHIVGTSAIGSEILGPYQQGRGGPGGWWILIEPEIEFEFEKNHFVPDLAGWKKERMPIPPKGHIFTIVPDWICEFVLPSSVRMDRVVKFRNYAQYGVKYYWIADPEVRALECFKLSPEKQWLSLGSFQLNDKVRVEPFDAIEIDLSLLWIPIEEDKSTT